MLLNDREEKKEERGDESRRDSSRNLSQEPVIWTVSFVNDTIRSVRDGGWDSFSKPVEIDGVTLFLSNDPISSILVSATANTWYHGLTIQEPARCFAFHRWRSALRSDRSPSAWLYSAFGYVTETERIILQVSAAIGRTVIQKRTSPFDLTTFGSL